MSQLTRANLHEISHSQTCTRHLDTKVISWQLRLEDLLGELVHGNLTRACAAHLRIALACRDAQSTCARRESCAEGLGRALAQKSSQHRSLSVTEGQTLQISALARAQASRARNTEAYQSQKEQTLQISALAHTRASVTHTHVGFICFDLPWQELRHAAAECCMQTARAHTQTHTHTPTHTRAHARTQHQLLTNHSTGTPARRLALLVFGHVPLCFRATRGSSCRYYFPAVGVVPPAPVDFCRPPWKLRAA